MAKKKMGFSFFPKTRARRRLKKLAQEADVVKGRVCKLKDDVDRELTVANDIFTGAEYDRAESAIQQKLDEACDCAGGGSSGGGGGGGADSSAKADCIEKIATAKGIAKNKNGNYGGKGALLAPFKKDIDDCIKGKGGSP